MHRSHGERENHINGIGEFLYEFNLNCFFGGV